MGVPHDPGIPPPPMNAHPLPVIRGPSERRGVRAEGLLGHRTWTGAHQAVRTSPLGGAGVPPGVDALPLEVAPLPLRVAGVPLEVVGLPRAGVASRGGADETSAPLGVAGAVGAVREAAAAMTATAAKLGSLVTSGEEDLRRFRRTRDLFRVGGGAAAHGDGRERRGGT